MISTKRLMYCDINIRDFQFGIFFGSQGKINFTKISTFVGSFFMFYMGKSKVATNTYIPIHIWVNLIF